MSLRKNQIKQQVLILSLVYLFLSGYMMIGEQRHAFDHTRRANHAARHASLICSWMCAASTFVHLAGPDLEQGLTPSFEDLVVSIEPFSSRLSVFYFHGRSPPAALS